MSDEGCGQCKAIEARPTHGWESVMLGGIVSRGTISMRVQNWSCPECGQAWKSVTDKGTSAIQWLKEN